jgi:hypothetical protein
MRPVLLIGLAMLAATSAHANVGDTIAQSVQRYGKPAVLDGSKDRLIWDNGSITFEATFDRSGHCDMMEIYGSWPFNELEIAAYLSLNMVGPDYTTKCRPLRAGAGKPMIPMGLWRTTVS